MNGPEHYRAAELLLAEAGQQAGEASARSIATAQVHATLALAAATAVGMAGPDLQAWADVAATKPSASKPEAPSAGPPGSGLEPRRPPPLFPPDDTSGH